MPFLLLLLAVTCGNTQMHVQPGKLAWTLAARVFAGASSQAACVVSLSVQLLWGLELMCHVTKLPPSLCFPAHFTRGDHFPLFED
jgi:hypothetical protein